MYKVFFEPTYEENKYLGEVSTADEALELICDYCVDHQYSPNISHWHKIDAPYREIIDVGTYYFIVEGKGNYSTPAGGIKKYIYVNKHIMVILSEGGFTAEAEGSL